MAILKQNCHELPRGFSSLYLVGPLVADVVLAGWEHWVWLKHTRF